MTKNIGVFYLFTVLYRNAPLIEQS